MGTTTTTTIAGGAGGISDSQLAGAGIIGAVVLLALAGLLVYMRWYNLAALKAVVPAAARNGQSLALTPVDVSQVNVAAASPQPVTAKAKGTVGEVGEFRFEGAEEVTWAWEPQPSAKLESKGDTALLTYLKAGEVKLTGAGKKGGQDVTMEVIITVEAAAAAAKPTLSVPLLTGNVGRTVLIIAGLGVVAILAVFETLDGGTVGTLLGAILGIGAAVGAAGRQSGSGDNQQD